MADVEYGKKMCPGCGEPVPVVQTSYGERIVCQGEGRRWTRIRETCHGQHKPNWNGWVEEKCNVMEGWWLDGQG